MGRNESNLQVETGVTQGAGLIELATLLRGYGATYSFLARLFRREINEEELDALRATLFPAETGNGLADQGIHKLVTYLDSAWENSTVELAVDYTRAFLGHGMDTYATAYPYESVYTSKHRLLMQEAYSEVLAAYRAAGVVRAEGSNEEEDHLALELEFEALLCNRAAAAFETDDVKAAWNALQARSDFLHNHLLNWVPSFAADVRRFARTGFYLGLADYLEGFLQTDAALLDELLADQPGV